MNRGDIKLAYDRAIAHDVPDVADRLYEMTDRISALEALTDRLKQEAQIHAQEARTANATIAEIYQAVTGSTGEPGNWNSAKPVIEAISALKARVAELEAQSGEAVAEVVIFDPSLELFPPKRPHKIIDGSMAFMERAEIGTKLYLRDLQAVPVGWTIERTDRKPFKRITIKAPNGYSAVVDSIARNPENILYMLAESLIAAAPSPEGE